MKQKVKFGMELILSTLTFYASAISLLLKRISMKLARILSHSEQEHRQDPRRQISPTGPKSNTSQRRNGSRTLDRMRGVSTDPD